MLRARQKLNVNAYYAPIMPRVDKLENGKSAIVYKDDARMCDAAALDDLLHDAVPQHLVGHARHIVELHEEGLALGVLHDVAVVVEARLDEAVHGIVPERGEFW